MKKLLLAIALTALAWTPVSWGVDATKETRPVEDFTSVEINGAPDVEWSPADKPSLEIDASPAC